MSMPFDLNGGLKMCDEQGRTVAVVLANQAFEKLTTETNQFRDEAARLRAEVLELRRTLETAREELREKAAIIVERDMYRKSILAMTHEDFTFTAEEIADMDKNGVRFEEKFIEELERDLRSQELSDGTHDPDEPTIIPNKKHV